MAIEEKIEYRFFLTDLLSNEIISEVPFKDVSFSRQIRRAGDFSGKIPFIPQTKGLNLYESTMPGRTGLYVMRNGVCVWGGIIWSRSYDVLSKELDVSAAEFISYFYHRHIWQTLVYGTKFIGIASYSITSGVATVVTEEPHGFTTGDKVAITFTSPLVDGVRTVTSVNSATQFTFDVVSANIASTAINSGAVRGLVDTYDFVRDLLNLTAIDLAGINFANEEIEPSQTLEDAVISKQRFNNVVTLETSSPHSIVIGQEINVYEVDDSLNGVHIVTSIPSNTSLTYELPGPNISKSSLPGLRTINIATKSLTAIPGASTIDSPAVATITLSEAHNAGIGQRVLLQGVDSFFSDRLDKRYDGLFEISGIPSANSLTFNTTGILDEPTASVVGGTATFGSKIVYGSYGSFAYNADIAIDTSNETSGLFQEQKIYRGFELKTVGEILEEYSENINGFEYRIDCDYDYDTASFTRTFVLLDLSGPAELEEGGLPDVARFGADKVVFEYPGNISTFTVDESAENAATRMFTMGKIDDLSGDASQPYSAASATQLLSNPNGKSWPLLDQAESVDGVSDEQELYSYAQDYLYESLPPISEFSLTVNGSLSPVVGSYKPGDFCSIIVNDEFVRQRLASDSEPRDDIIIRKIVSYSVNVPDSPHYPEDVSLELITDWKVEENGN